MRRSCSHILNNILGHPRLILFMCSMLLGAIAITNLHSAPDYVVSPVASSILTLTGSAACLVAMFRPTMWTMAFAGAALAGAIATRGFGLTANLLFDEWKGEASVPILIGDLAWMTMLTMLPPLWSKHLIPWAVVAAIAKDEE